MPRQPLILKHKFALGDTVCLTALVRDIEKAYPGRFDIKVNTHFRNMFNNNPYATLYEPGKDDNRAGVTHAKIEYRSGIQRAGRGERIHMIRYYHESFKQATGVDVPLTLPKGDLHLTEEEQKPIIEGRYWLLNAGGKNDATVKVWRPEMWQRVVDMLREHGIWCVQSGVRYTKHFHPKLKNCVDAIDHHDDARMLCNMIQHADGVLCPITAMMHISAVYDTPCVVVAGGREEPWWESYNHDYPEAFGEACAPVKVPHRYLHTIGQLECCEKKGCWKHRTVKLNIHDGFDTPNRLCKMPVSVQGSYGPKCLDLITPEEVVEAVLSYGTTTGGKPVDTSEIRQMITAPIIPGFGSTLKPAKTDTPKPRIVRAGNRKMRADEQPPEPKESNAQGVENPIIGGKYTVFVLCYGNYTKLAETCLNSILSTVPNDKLDIRVICHEVAPATLEYLRTLPITKIYEHKKNRGKYESMREAFNDPDCPITTNYVLWFDDDTKIIRDDWLKALTATILAGHPKGNRLFGWKMIHDTKMFAKGGNDPISWFRSADWWVGRNLRVRGKFQEAPNGTVIEFAVGWFWAISAATIVKGNIPDSRLNHNGGDITIGEQVHQTGGKIQNFNANKTHVWCPTKQNGGRRGYSEKFPWASP